MKCQVTTVLAFSWLVMCSAFKHAETNANTLAENMSNPAKCQGAEIKACHELNGQPPADCKKRYVILAAGVAYQCGQAVGNSCGTTGPECTPDPLPWSTLDFKEVNGKTPKVEGSWKLALNIDTDDGHSVQYRNTDFWESATATGTNIAKGSFNLNDWAGDYKDVEAFNAKASKVLIVVHEGKTVKGWRSWPTVSKKSLQEFFNQGNKCPSGMTTTKYNIATSSDDFATASTLSIQEPMVRNSDNANRVKELCANHNNGDDLNRLTTCGETVKNNQGWGLGTHYDSLNCNANTARPMCDGQLASTSTWQRGLIGHDQNCGESGVKVTPYDSTTSTKCTWSHKTYPGASGLNYDYAIFVQE